MPDRISEGRRGWARTTALGASSPLQCPPAKVPSLNPLRTFPIGDDGRQPMPPWLTRQLTFPLDIIAGQPGASPAVQVC